MLLVTAIVFVIAIPSALGNGAVAFLGHLPIVEMDFLTLMSTIWNDFALPVGGLLTALFVGWVWRTDRAIDEVELHGTRFPGSGLWSFLIRWACPVAIGSIILFTVASM